MLVPFIENLAGLYSHDNEILLNNLIFFRRMLSRTSQLIMKQTIDKVIQIGILHRISIILKTHYDDDIVFECLWILTNIASGLRRYCQKILDSGCLKYIILHCDSNIMNIREQAIWCLGNLLGEKDILDIPKHHIKDIVLNNISHDNDNIRRQISWNVSNIFRNNILLDDEELIRIVIEQLQNENNTIIINELLWAFSFISSENELIDLLVKYDFINICLKYINNFKTICLRNIGNLIVGSDEVVEKLFEKGLYNILLENISTHPKEIIWMCSNIATGPPHHKNKLISLIPKCLNIVNNSDNTTVYKEFWWFMENLFKKNGLNIFLIDRHSILKVLLKKNIFETINFPNFVKKKIILSIICYEHKNTLHITHFDNIVIPDNVLTYHNRLFEKYKKTNNSLKKYFPSYISNEITYFLHTLH